MAAASLIVDHVSTHQEDLARCALIPNRWVISAQTRIILPVSIGRLAPKECNPLNRASTASTKIMFTSELVVMGAVML